MLQNDLIPIWHAGTGEERHIALYFVREVQLGELVRGKDLLTLDGKHLEEGSFIFCGTCGDRLQRPMKAEGKYYFIFTDFLWKEKVGGR